MEVGLENFYVVIGGERVNLKLDDSDKHRPQGKQLCVCEFVCLRWDWGAHSVLGLG